MFSKVSNSFRLSATWTSLQRAETLLFHAAEAQNPEKAEQLFAGLELPSRGLALLIRSGMGFDTENLRPEYYFARYPFSDAGEIRAAYDQLAEEGFLQKQNESYAFQANSRHIYLTWMDRVQEMMQSLDLGDITVDEVQKLLAYDHRIVEALEKASRPHSKHILCQHLRSLRPSFDARELWHHWPLVGTMLTAFEDEDETFRQQSGLTPLVWFTRNQVWFYHRRPWLYQVRTLDHLVRRATGYSPMKDAPQACEAAVRELEALGWLTTTEGEYRLTEVGLAVTDADKEKVEANFLAAWPELSEKEIEELYTMTVRLNDRFTELQHK